MHHVVKALAARHQVVDTSHDTEDTEREDPDTDNGDNGSLVTTLEETPDGEAGSEDIDDQDGASELPRGDGRPERTVGSGNEDQPVLSKGDLEEENLVHVTEVLHDTTIGTLSVHGSEGDPGTDSKDYSKDNGHSPELGQVPLDGGLGERSVIVGDGQGSNISEDGNEDNQLNVKRTVQNSDP